MAKKVLKPNVLPTAKSISMSFTAIACLSFLMADLQSNSFT